MPPRTALSTPLRAWRCSQCRAFATTPRRRTLGPEHPRYIEVPEPPQQQAPYLPFPKGRLPVPRDVFRRAQDRDKASDEQIEKAAPAPKSRPQHAKGSRLEWKQKMSESRRQNLREGLKTLRVRKDTESRRRLERSERKIAEHEALIRMPEREDERLTAPSHGLDLHKLLKGTVPDPNREERVARKAALVAQHAERQREIRQDHMHTLYMRARNFIVTPQQLDKAVDEAFGTPDNPVTFPSGTSKWGQGPPDSLQDMLDMANGLKGRGAVSSALNQSVSIGQAERMKKIAESLTGGKMD